MKRIICAFVFSLIIMMVSLAFASPPIADKGFAKAAITGTSIKSEPMIKITTFPTAVPVPAFAADGHNATAVFKTGILVQREPVEKQAAVADTWVATTAKIYPTEEDPIKNPVLSDTRTGVVQTRAVIAEKGAMITAPDVGHGTNTVNLIWAAWAILEQEYLLFTGAGSSSG